MRCCPLFLLCLVSLLCRGCLFCCCFSCFILVVLLCCLCLCYVVSCFGERFCFDVGGRDVVVLICRCSFLLKWLLFLSWVFCCCRCVVGLLLCLLSFFVLPLLLLSCWLVRVVSVGVLLFTVLLDVFVGLLLVLNVVLCFFCVLFVDLLLLRCCG